MKSFVYFLKFFAFAFDKIENVVNRSLARRFNLVGNQKERKKDSEISANAETRRQTHVMQ